MCENDSEMTRCIGREEERGGGEGKGREGGVKKEGRFSSYAILPFDLERMRSEVLAVPGV